MSRARAALPFLLLAAAQAAGPLPHKLEGVYIEDLPGAQVPRGPARVLDERGAAVDFAAFHDGKRPLLLVIAYYNCPMLCSLVQGAAVSAVNEVPLVAGADYRMVTVSMDPKDKPDAAAKYAARYRGLLKRKRGDEAWTFLTGETPEIRKVTDAVGFHYRYDPQTGEYLHVAGIFVLTPAGKVSRVFTGVDYRPFDLRLALTEAKDGKTRSTAEHFLLYCYQYDPAKEGYGLRAKTAARILGPILVGGLALFIALLVRRRKKRAAAEPP